MDAQTPLILNIELMNLFPQDMYLYLQISFTVLTQDVKTLNSKKDKTNSGRAANEMRLYFSTCINKQTEKGLAAISL
jgi:hypothetical protein